MLEQTNPIELPKSCIIFVGGQAWQLENLRWAEPIEGRDFVRFTKPDGQEELMELLPPFATTPELVETGIALGLGGLTEQVWNRLSSEEQERRHAKEKKLRATFGEKALSIFRG